MKTLYKLARKKLFVKTYFCGYCDFIDFDKQFMRGHVRHYHDETGNVITLFICKLCHFQKTCAENEIIRHIFKNHGNEQ